MALMNVLPGESRMSGADPTVTLSDGRSVPYDQKAVQDILNKPKVGNPFPAGSPEWIAVANARSGQQSTSGQQNYEPGQGPANLGATGGAPSGGINWQADPQTLTQQLNAYFTSKGVPTTEVPYWVSKAPELVQRGQEINNPGYADMRLGQSEILGGHYGSPSGGGQGGATFGGAFGGDPESVMKMDPGYQFRFGEGLQALQRGAAAKGTLLTGGTQAALERYGQDYASGEFGNIFNRNLSLAQLGENAAAGVGNFGANYAANAGNLLTGGGNAAAAGTVGSANAWGGTLGDISNSAMLYYLMNQNKAKGTSGAV